MSLEIDFLDGYPEMEMGSTARVRVLTRDAEGNQKTVGLDRVAFHFEPVVWGEVKSADEPGVGILTVVALAESDDPLDEPEYGIEARLAVQGLQRIKKAKRIRLLPVSLEIELAFEVGQFKRFELGDLKQPIDWSQARVGDPETQQLFTRDGVAYLRVTPPDALPAEVEITFPNGQVATLALEGGVRERGEAVDEGAATVDASSEDMPLEMPPPVEEAPLDEQLEEEASREEEEAQEAAARLAPAPQPTPAPAPTTPTPPPAPVIQRPPVDPQLREDLARLRNYVGSFSGARSRSDASDQAKIQERITAKVEAFRPRLEAYHGADRAELLAAFEELCRETLAKA
jgi:hypothetical protein